MGVVKLRTQGPARRSRNRIFNAKTPGGREAQGSEGAGLKAPNTNIQAPEKFQAPTSMVNRNGHKTRKEKFTRSFSEVSLCGLRVADPLDGLGKTFCSNQCHLISVR